MEKKKFIYSVVYKFGEKGFERETLVEAENKEEAIKELVKLVGEEKEGKPLYYDSPEFEVSNCPEDMDVCEGCPYCLACSEE